jgi:hypothetical protein
VIAALIQLLLCTLDLDHCTRISATAGGLRCVEVQLAPSCPIDRAGWHVVLGTPVCTRDCRDGRPTS